MSKPARLPIRKSPSGRWSYDLPAGISETGGRQRKTFKTRKLAELSREADLKRNSLYGAEGRMLTASLAQDAAKAIELLKPYEVSLVQAAREIVRIRERDRASQPFDTLWEFFCESRAQKSDTYNRTLRQIGDKLRPLIGQQLVSQLAHDEIRSAIRKSYPTAFGFNLALRSVSAAFNVAVREGWCSLNPCKRIAKIDTGRKEIEVLSLEQCRLLFNFCRDYRKDLSLKTFTSVWTPETLTLPLRSCSLLEYGRMKPHVWIGRTLIWMKAPYLFVTLRRRRIARVTSRCLIACELGLRHTRNPSVRDQSFRPVGKE